MSELRFDPQKFLNQQAVIPVGHDGLLLRATCVAAGYKQPHIVAQGHHLAQPFVTMVPVGAVTESKPIVWERWYDLQWKIWTPEEFEELQRIAKDRSFTGSKMLGIRYRFLQWSLVAPGEAGTQTSELGDKLVAMPRLRVAPKAYQE